MKSALGQKTRTLLTVEKNTSKTTVKVGRKTDSLRVEAQYGIQEIHDKKMGIFVFSEEVQNKFNKISSSE